MQVSTSTDCPRARGSGRRTTNRKVNSGSPLGRVRISAGADTRPRSTTSFRSITATLMQASLLVRPPPAQRPAASVDAAGQCGRRSPICRGLVPVGRVVSVVRVLGRVAGRRVDLPEELGDLRLDLFVEALAESVVVFGQRLDYLGCGRFHGRLGLSCHRAVSLSVVGPGWVGLVEVVVLQIGERDAEPVDGTGEVLGISGGDG